MSLANINDLSTQIPEIQSTVSKPLEPNSLDFRVVFKNALQEVNALDTQAKTMVEALATGKTNDISGTMMSVQKATTAFNMLLQIRNKVIESYEEIMRMRM